MARDKNKEEIWREKNIRRYSFTLNRTTDKDVYEYFETIENKREYLINLIRKDIQSNH